jgi:hypothetical protein
MLLGIGACGPSCNDTLVPSGMTTDSDGSTTGSTSGQSGDGNSEGPKAPDLGSAAITCGEPGEYVATAEALAAMEGCERFRGAVFVPHAFTGDLLVLTALRVIEEDFGSLSNNANLETLEGLNQLQWVGSFSFSQDALLDLSAMSNLVGVDDFFDISALPNLVDCHGLASLATIGGTVSFEANGELTSLDGLSGLEWIGGDLEIVDNAKLESLSGLSNLRRVDGSVRIQFNGALPADEIDSLLSRIEVGGDVILD